jgi:hypothetical protein
MKKGRLMGRKTVRLALLACVAAGALVFAGSALATPRLIIGGQTALGSSQVSIQFLEEKTDASPARITIYAPAGYTGTVTAAAGTQLGTVHADLQALAISPDAIISADGQIIADNPATHTTDACSPGLHTAVWILRVTVSGQTINVPAYIDAPSPNTDPLSGTSPFRITFCFTSPYVAPPVGAPFGAKIVNAVLQLNQGTLTTPSSRGSYGWRAVVTPYTVGSANPNAAGTVEARGVVDTPDLLSIAVKVTNKKKRTVRIAGNLRAGDFVLGGATVSLTGSVKAKKKTNSGGNVVFTTRFKKKGTYTFRLTSTVLPYDITSDGCKTPTAPTLPCASATANGFVVASRTVRVRIT